MSLPTPTDPPVSSLPLPDPVAYEGEPREYATALMQRKDAIEKAMDDLRNTLASHGTTSSTSLLDPEGYPRADIDIYAIRHARAALARLTTDLGCVNDLLPSALAAAFQSGPSGPSGSSAAFSNRASSPSDSSPVSPALESNGHGPPVARGAGDDDMPDEWPSGPIARVNSVEPNGPAYEAGLRPQDLIFSFSSVTITTSGGLQAIGAVVQRSEGVPLTILVLRGSERVRLRLTPRSAWGGRGSLGCHILPV